MIFLNSASSAAALVFYLPGVRTHTDTERKQRKARVRNIIKSSKNTQYLINKLYLVIIDPVFILYTLYFLEPVIILQNILLNIKRRKSLLLLTFKLCQVARVVAWVFDGYSCKIVPDIQNAITKIPFLHDLFFFLNKFIWMICQLFKI